MGFFRSVPALVFSLTALALVIWMAAVSVGASAY
jgi:hypothetical protein